MESGSCMSVMMSTLTTGKEVQVFSFLCLNADFRGENLKAGYLLVFLRKFRPLKYNVQGRGKLLLAESAPFLKNTPTRTLTTKTTNATKEICIYECHSNNMVVPMMIADPVCHTPTTHIPGHGCCCWSNIPPPNL